MNGEHPLIDLSSRSCTTKSQLRDDRRDNRDRGKGVRGLTNVGDVFTDLTHKHLVHRQAQLVLDLYGAEQPA